MLCSFLKPPFYSSYRNATKLFLYKTTFSSLFIPECRDAFIFLKRLSLLHTRMSRCFVRSQTPLSFPYQNITIPCFFSNASLFFIPECARMPCFSLKRLSLLHTSMPRCLGFFSQTPLSSSYQNVTMPCSFSNALFVSSSYRNVTMPCSFSTVSLFFIPECHDALFFLNRLIFYLLHTRMSRYLVLSQPPLSSSYQHATMPFFFFLKRLSLLHTSMPRCLFFSFSNASLFFIQECHDALFFLKRLSLLHIGIP